MTPTRIYKVEALQADAISEVPPRLVRAANVAQAIRHVAQATLTASVASQDDLVDLITTGTAVEAAGDDKSTEVSA